MGPKILKSLMILAVLVLYLFTGTDLVMAGFPSPEGSPKTLPPQQNEPENKPPSGSLPPSDQVWPTIDEDPTNEDPVPGSEQPGDNQEEDNQGQLPGTSPGPGGGGGSAPGNNPTPAGTQFPASQTVVNSGTITVEPVTGTLTLAADRNKLAGLAAQAREKGQDRINLSLFNPGGTPVAQYRALIPLQALKDIEKSKLNLVIASERASVVLPPALLKGLTKDSAGELQLTMSTASGIDRQKISQSAGETAEISFSIKDGKGNSQVIHGFPSPVTLNLRYDPKIPQNKLSRLGIYRYNEKTGAWAYVGGTVKASDGVVSIERQSFSRYSVRLYEKGFIDLVGHWARTDVELLASQGLVKGYSDLVYGPEQKITRAEFAVLLQRALNLKVSKASSFKDIRQKEWYAGGVAAAAKAGLIKGYNDETFKPNAPITRQEMAVMLTRALTKHKQVKLSGDPLKAFTDRTKMASWAQQQLAVAVQAGLIKGQRVTEFAPLKNATRAEAAVMLKRLRANLNIKK